MIFFLHRTPQDYKLLEIREFSKMFEIKINIQKSPPFLYVISRHQEM